MSYKNPSLIHSSVRKVFNIPKTVFLLDVSWHLHRGASTFKNFTAGPGGRFTGHIYGFLNTIKLIRNNFPDALIVFCKDGKPVRRQKIMEDRGESYKEGRPELEFNIYGDYSLIIASASLLGGVFEAFLPDQESDDLMSNLCRQIKEVSPKSFCYVYSGDDDLLQTIDDDHSCVIRKFDAGKPVKIDNTFLKMDERMLQKYHGVDSYHLPYYRSICGDHSDVIPGIPRFNRDVAKKLAMQVNCLDDLFKFVNPTQDKTFDRWNYELHQNKERVKQNFQLMALRDEFEIVLKAYSPNVDLVKAKLRQYHLNGFLSYLNQKGI